MCFLWGTNVINDVFWIEDRTMDNIQNCDGYINVPSPQTYRSYQHYNQVETYGGNYLFESPL
jgi:hypothetical protein